MHAWPIPPISEKRERKIEKERIEIDTQRKRVTERNDDLQGGFQLLYVLNNLHPLLGRFLSLQPLLCGSNSDNVLEELD